MIHTFAGDFTNWFELIASILIGVIPISLFVVLWYDHWKAKREEARKNKKAS